MAKKKNKGKKNKSLYKAIKPFVKDNRVLLSILGATGVGVALASAFGTDNVKSWIDKLSEAVTNQGSEGTIVSKNSRSPKVSATT